MSRRDRRGGGILSTAAVIVIVVVALGAIANMFLGWSLPFSKETKDHSPPIVLTELRDLAEFRAAEAEFEIIVDRETDVKWIPGFVAGERVQYVAVGTIDAMVDFSGLDEDSIFFDEDENSATVILPAPMYTDPVIDYENSGVMNRDRGVLDRLGGVFNDNPTAEESLIVEAQGKMVEAVPETDLLERAEANTEAMLTTLLNGVGVEEVDVRFEQPTAT